MTKEEDARIISVEKTLALGRKRSASDDKRIQKRGYLGPIDGDTNMKKNDEEEMMDARNEIRSPKEAFLDLSTLEDSFLVNLPSNLLTHLGGFLTVNDMTALTMTNKSMYSSRPEYRYLHHKNNGPFRLVLEEKRPIIHDLKSVLEPCHFLFQSAKYGTLQVDFATVSPPKGGYLRGYPRLRHSYARGNQKEPWEDLAFRINIQKKFPKEEPDNTPSLTTAKVIFRIDQSMPGCCFHFESKFVVGWDAGDLGYLIQTCVTRLVHMQSLANKEPEEGLVLVRPSEEDILRKFQATVRENTHRLVKKRVEEKKKEAC